MKAKVIMVGLAALVAAGLFQSQSAALPETPKEGVKFANSWATKSYTPRFAAFPVGEARPVDLDLPGETRERLSQRERQDQLLDWLLMVVMNDAGLTEEKLAEALFDLPPIRYGYTKATGSFEYGVSRSRTLDDGTIVALIPSRLSGKARQDEIAAIVDRHREDQAGEIGNLAVFDYEIAAGDLEATLTRRAEVPATSYLSASAGYHQRQIASLADLRSFLTLVDSVTYVVYRSQFLGPELS